MTDQCEHVSVKKTGEKQWQCVPCGLMFFPEGVIEDIQADASFQVNAYLDAGAALLVRVQKIMADANMPMGSADTTMYAPDECPGHEGNPCQHCGASVFLGAQ